MLNYNDRMNQAWEQIPSHRQKEILEELERKAYKQDFATEVNNQDSQDNFLEPIVDLVFNAIKLIINKLK